MGAAELGEYVLAYSWLIMLAVIPVSGFSGAAIRFVGQGLADEDHGYIRGFIRHASRFAVLASVATAVVAAAVIIGSPGLSGPQAGLFLAAMAGVPFFTLIKLDSGLANAFSRFGLSFLPENIVRPLLFLSGIFLAWQFEWGLDSRLAMLVQLSAIVAVSVPLTFYLYRSTHRRLEPAPPKRDQKLWNRTAASLLVLGIFTNYFPEITVVLIGFFLPSPDIAIYTVSFRLALLIFFVLFAVDAFTAPSLARHHRKNERAELLIVLARATKLRFLAASLCVIFFVLFGKLVLGLFGNEFIKGYAILLVLSMGQLVVAAVGPSVRLLSVSGHHNQGLHASAIALSIWLLLAAILVPAFGVTGAAVSAFLTLTVWSATLRHFVMRSLHIDPLILPRDLLSH